MRTCTTCGYLLLIVLLSMVGCDRSAPPASRVEPIGVMASVYPLADVAKEIGGEMVSVGWVVEAGQLPGNPSIDSGVHSKLLSARVIISGGATEPWIATELGPGLSEERLLRLDRFDLAKEITEDVGYLWLDPNFPRALADELRKRLAILRPKEEPRLRAQADQFVRKIDALNKTYVHLFADVKNKYVLVLNNDYIAMLRRIGVVPIQPVSAAPSRLDEPAIWALKQSAEQNKTRVLLVSSDTPPGIIKEIESRAGLNVVTIDALGSSATGGRNNYIDLMKYNYDRVLAATSIR